MFSKMQKKKKKKLFVFTFKVTFVKEAEFQNQEIVFVFVFLSFFLAFFRSLNLFRSQAPSYILKMLSPLLFILEFIYFSFSLLCFFFSLTTVSLL
jgi:hypothetical protein